MEKRKIVYHYRGGVERGANYHWRDGYSENSENGFPLYPWKTRPECRRDARKRGGIAIFYRDGRPETASVARMP